MGYTSIYEAWNIRYQESHCTDYDSYGENDPIQSFFGKHDSGWGISFEYAVALRAPSESVRLAPLSLDFQQMPCQTSSIVQNCAHHG